MSRSTQTVRRKLDKDGYASLKGFFDSSKSIELKDKIIAKRPDGPYRFYKTEKAFVKNGRYDRTNPDLEFNLLNNFDLSFIDEKLTNLVKDVFQSDVSVGSRKIIRNIPTKSLPDWLKKYRNFIRHNVNPYILDKYQDEGLYYGADVHQDHIGDDNSWFTAYIYLENVTEKNSPLNFFTGSHALGKSDYPPQVRKIDKKILYYNERGSMFTKKVPIEGKAGDLVLFNAYTLHSTMVNRSVKERVSLRYLFKIHDFSFEDVFEENRRHLTFQKEMDFRHLIGKNSI